MKYLKDLSKIFIFVLIMFLPINMIAIYFLMNKYDEKVKSETLAEFSKAISMVQERLSNDDMEDVCLRLEAQYRARSIGAYLISDSENSCYMPASFKTLPGDSLSVGEFKDVTVFGSPLTLTHGLTDKYSWYLGVATPTEHSFSFQLFHSWDFIKSLIQEILLAAYTVFTFALLAVLIYTNTIKKQFSSNQKAKDHFFIRLLNKLFSWLQLDDLKIVNAATKALVKQNKDLEKDIDLLETSLEASILNEIRENSLQIPYSFFGTVAKIDINGFSKVVALGRSDISGQMTTHLEEFGCELLKRYNGLFEKTIGDEIVVVFKGGHSQLRACAFVRDLMTEFSNITFKVGDSLKQFTLKSAISQSELTFSKRVSGYGFLGESLTVTTRLMDAVNDKSVNNLSILEHDFNSIHQLIHKPKLTIEHDFKNMGTKSCYIVNSFLTIEDVFNHVHANPDYSDLVYFKSDKDIVYLLKRLNHFNSSEEALVILSCLSQINTYFVLDSVIEQWLSTLLGLLKIIEKSPTDVHFKILAKYLMTSTTLIPQTQWLKNLTDAILNIPHQLDGRINASVIDILIHFDLQAASSLDVQKYVLHSDRSSRTEANILIMKSLIKLDNIVFDQLILMIKSSDPLRSRSGLYASGKIISYYQKHNPAELELYTSYKKLKELLFQIRSSSRIKLTDRVQNQLDAIALD